MTIKEKMAEVKRQGLNIYMLLNKYKKDSKLKEEIPENVVLRVCDVYLEKGGKVNHSYPYFLRVLEMCTREFFAHRNIQEHKKLKDEPMSLAEILRRASDKH